MASVRHLGFFPHCVPTSNPIFNANDRWSAEILECDLFTAMALFWRIKKLKLNIVATYSYDAYDEYGGTYPYTNTKSFELVYSLTSPSDELGLICSGPFWVVTTQNSPVEIWNATESPTLNFSPTWRDGETYYVGSNFGAIVRDNAESPAGAIGAALLFGLPPLDHPWWDGYPVSDIVSFSRETIDLGNNIKVTTNVVTFESSKFYNTSIDSWELRADEFWPYDPEDGGGPIYNSATGARIRNDV